MRGTVQRWMFGRARGGFARPPRSVPILTGGPPASRLACDGERGKPLKTGRKPPNSPGQPIEQSETSVSATVKETLSFQAEVKQLLHLMIHSLYSNK
jgi:hypothetical protein